MFEIIVHPCGPGRQGNAPLPDRHYFRRVVEAATGPGTEVLSDILSFEGNRIEIEAGDEAEVLARALDFDYARTHATDRTWRFYPAEPVSDLVVSKVAGGGTLIYVAADLDQAYLVEGKAETARLLASLPAAVLADDIEVELMSPEFGMVELAAYRCGTDTVLIMLRNQMTNQRWGGSKAFRSPLSWQKRALVNYVAPIHDVHVQLKSDGRQIASCTALAGGEVQTASSGAGHEVVLTSMDEVEAIIVKFQ